jgi:hypothetical protein
MAGNAQAKVIGAAYDNGVSEGRREVRKQVLDFLEEAYMKPNVKHKTPLAEGILDLARELSELMKV